METLLKMNQEARGEAVVPWLFTKHKGLISVCCSPHNTPSFYKRVSSTWVQRTRVWLTVARGPDRNSLLIASENWFAGEAPAYLSVLGSTGCHASTVPMSGI